MSPPETQQRLQQQNTHWTYTGNMMQNKGFSHLDPFSIEIKARMDEFHRSDRDLGYADLHEMFGPSPPAPMKSMNHMAIG